MFLFEDPTNRQRRHSTFGRELLACYLSVKYLKFLRWKPLHHRPHPTYFSYSATFKSIYTTSGLSIPIRIGVSSHTRKRKRGSRRPVSSPHQQFSFKTHNRPKAHSRRTRKMWSTQMWIGGISNRIFHRRSWDNSTLWPLNRENTSKSPSVPPTSGFRLNALTLPSWC